MSHRLSKPGNVPKSGHHLYEDVAASLSGKSTEAHSDSHNEKAQGTQRDADRTEATASDERGEVKFSTKMTSHLNKNRTLYAVGLTIAAGSLFALAWRNRSTSLTEI